MTKVRLYKGEIIYRSQQVWDGRCPFCKHNWCAQVYLSVSLCTVIVTKVGWASLLFQLQRRPIWISHKEAGITHILYLSWQGAIIFVGDPEPLSAVSMDTEEYPLWEWGRAPGQHHLSCPKCRKSTYSCSWDSSWQRYWYWIRISRRRGFGINSTTSTVTKG